MLDHLLVHISERGLHATGFVSCHFGGKGVTLSKKDLPADEFITMRARPNMQHVQTILAHTRWATQGHQKHNENNHPVVFGTTFATHNGQISNDDEIIEDFDLKTTRPAEVDSIAIPIALASCGMDSITNIQEGLGKLAGGMACAVIDPVKHPGQVILARGASSPLIVLHTKYGFMWASTRASIEYMWGSLIGTPPTKKAKNPAELGWYEFNYGDAWLIDGNEAAPFKFKPAVNTRNFSGYGWSYQGGRGGTPGTGYFPDDWEHYKSYQERVAAGDPLISKVSRYTCTPNSTSCEHPCKTGCRTGACTCKATIWKHEGTEYGFDPTELLKARKNNGCSVPSAADECDTPNFCGKRGRCNCTQYDGTSLGHAAAVERLMAEQAARTARGIDRSHTFPGAAGEPLSEGVSPAGKVRCDSCWDWYTEAQLLTYTIGAEDFVLCAECAIAEGWGTTVSVIPDESAEDNEVMDHYQRVAEVANEAHKTACAKTAEALDCTQDFVDWVLFKATLDEMENGGETLQALRRVTEDEYENHYDEAIS